MGRYTTTQTFSDQDAQGAAVPYASAATTSSAPSDASAAPTHDAKDAAGLRVKRVDNVSGSGAGAGSGDFHTYRASRRREMERVAAMEQRYKQNKAQQEFEERRKRNAEEFQAKAEKRAAKRRRRKERAKALAMGGDSDGRKANENEASAEQKVPVLETPGGVPEIPNDGSFLEKMLALQKEQEEDKQEEQVTEDGKRDASEHDRQRRLLLLLDERGRVLVIGFCQVEDKRDVVLHALGALAIDCQAKCACDYGKKTHAGYWPSARLKL
ncbi:unnamed protein product [Hyaloperonospora brassicae]|uniref:IBB domain-containing protein n=1 Tax=Hyaloperonospora brassicae TaxID=162125 RepID=A0AAV0T0X2_HYABA|nr:unnamed protein product [Hyaloperonospora brassicae]